MSKKHSAKRPHLFREIAALLWLAGTFFLIASLWSYSVVDPSLFRPGGEGPVSNLGGFVGATIAKPLFRIFGVAVWLLPCAGAYVSWRFVQREPCQHKLIRILSFICLLLSFAGLVGLLLPRIVGLNHHLYGLDGYVGHEFAGMLVEWLNPAGSFVLFLLLISLSLTGFFCLSPLAWLARVSEPLHLPRRFIGQALSRIRGPAGSMTYPDSVAEEEYVTTSECVESGVQEACSTLAFELPSLKLLKPAKAVQSSHDKGVCEITKGILESKLAEFGVRGAVVAVRSGPVVSMYEFKPAPGIKLNRIAGLADDLAMALRAPAVRIIAPIPGRDVVGIEIPNRERSEVTLRDVFDSKVYRHSSASLPVAMGEDVFGAPTICDLSNMPHLLVAGTTGSGKSVFINTLILSLLFRKTPKHVRLLMVDPKRLELSVYAGIPHLLHPVVTEVNEAVKALKWAVDEMDRRYKLLAEAGARDIEGYNVKISNVPSEETPMPRIVIVIDEYASLMRSAGRDIEAPLVRLAQMARAAGIHLVLATQRPSVDVVTGVIKANFSTRVAFQVSSNTDSRTVLDQPGAESLLGKGDMLFMSRDSSLLQRLHGAWVSDEEVERVVSFLSDQDASHLQQDILVATENSLTEMDMEPVDDKWDESLAIIAARKQASASMLQRELRIGYNRAARMIELMEKKGYVAPSDGTSRPREVFVECLPESDR